MAGDFETDLIGLLVRLGDLTKGSKPIRFGVIRNEFPFFADRCDE